MLAADAGMTGIALGALTLKSELLHEAVSSSSDQPSTIAAGLLIRLVRWKSILCLWVNSL